MKDLPETFTKGFNAAFAASKFNSLRDLSKESRSCAAQASKIARGGFLHSKNGPGIFNVYPMAVALGVSLDTLLPPPFDSSTRPSLSDFFDRYRGGATTLADYHDILDYCDIYDEPKLGRCKLISQGHQSLLTQKTGLIDVERQQAEFESWPADRRSSTFNWQRRAFEAGILAEQEHFQGTYEFDGLNLSGDISKAGCRFIGNDLKPRFLFFAEMKGQKQRSARNQQRKARFA